MLLGDRIKEVSKERKVSLQEIEADCGLAAGSLSRWNTISPSYDKVVKVAARLGVTVDELVGD